MKKIEIYPRVQFDSMRFDSLLCRRCCDTGQWYERRHGWSGFTWYTVDPEKAEELEALYQEHVKDKVDEAPVMIKLDKEVDPDEN